MRKAIAVTEAGARVSFPGVAVDTREGKSTAWRLHAGPLPDCRGWDYLPRFSRTIKTGDYSIVGLETAIAIERKSLSDAVSTFVGRNEMADGEEVMQWGRFSREMDRAEALEWFAIVIEGSREDVLKRRYMSQAHPRTILARADSIVTDWGFPVVWAGSREEAEYTAGWMLLRRWEAHLAAMPPPDALAIINRAREAAEDGKRAARLATKAGSPRVDVAPESDAGAVEGA